MQRQMTRPKESQEELNDLRTQLGTVEWERESALRELTEIKRRMNRSDIEKESLLNANKELRKKDKIIESLRSEVCKMKRLELKLEQKNASIEAMKNEQNNLKSSMARTEGLLSDTTLEVAALNQKIQESEEEYRQKYEADKEAIDRLGHELVVERENSNDANNKSEERKCLLDDIEVLKNELKQAMEAEENSKKAMDDFALVLKEVTSESNYTQEKLKATEEQLEVVTEEAANLKKMLLSSEQTSDSLISELKTDRDRLKNTVKRLRLEAEESHLAWNEKEVEFVNCIKKAEDENISLVEENNKLRESTRETGEMSFKLKDEIKKLRDVLKQAVTEANMAKEAANLARAENTYLKDFLEEKDRALVSLAQENERLRMKMSSAINFDLNQLSPGTPKSCKDIEDEEPENDDDLGGSISNIMASTMREGETPPLHHRRISSSAFADDGNTIDDAEQFDDLDLGLDKGKKKALARRFGDLLRRKKFSQSQGSIAKDLPQPQKEITV